MTSSLLFFHVVWQGVVEERIKGGRPHPPSPGAASGRGPTGVPVASTVSSAQPLGLPLAASARYAACPPLRPPVSASHFFFCTSLTLSRLVLFSGWPLQGA